MLSFLASPVGLQSAEVDVLHAFEGQPSASVPSGGLLPLAGQPDRLIGTSEQGGTYGAGTVFTIGTDGTGFTVIHDFDPANDGERPTGALVQDVDGWIYGTTRTGDSIASSGTIFRLLFDGSGFEVLHRFNSALDGAECWAGVIIASDGRLYGVARQGGSHSFGTLYSMNRDGTDFKVLRHFQSGNDDGSYPLGGLVEGSNGMIYGTTYSGGSTANGTVFRWNPGTAEFALLHAFDPNVSGHHPVAGLIQTRDNRLWGTTPTGGPETGGDIFSINPDGSDFRVEHVFDVLKEGAYSTSGLVSSDDEERLYGVTTSGGPNDAGTVFEIDFGEVGSATPPFPLRPVGVFANTVTGYFPTGRIFYRSTGSGLPTLFGVANSGGPTAKGTVWSLDVSPTPPSTVDEARLINMAARSKAGTGASTLIVGFVISGDGTKRVVIRGVGPKLADIGVEVPVVQDPLIRLYDTAGNVLAENDDWVSETAANAGGFKLDPGAKDAALDIELPPGGYTVHLVNNGTPAEGMIELYDMSLDEGTRFVNMSCRLDIAAGQTVIFGAVLSDGAMPLLIRSAGPSLAPLLLEQDRPLVASDPYLRFYDGSGTLMGENDDWDASLAARFAAVGAYAWIDSSKDAAGRVTVQPGAFTAHASTVGGGGIILIELYESP